MLTSEMSVALSTSSRLPLRPARWAAVLLLACSLLGAGYALSPPQTAQAPAASKSDFDLIEGVFHDGLGTFAEILLANELIAQARLAQTPFDATASRAKMRAAINRLPDADARRDRLQQEITHIEAATRRGAAELLKVAAPARLTGVRHTPREYQDAHAGDLRLVFEGRGEMPVSVKTDKSHKVAVAEGQTPDIGTKWALRYFRVAPAELDAMTRELGYGSMAELKGHYLNVARLVAHVLIRKLKLTDCEPTDFSRARVTDMEALKYLLRQLRHFKHGNDSSRVIIFDRTTGAVKWESLLDGVDIERLTPERVSFLPAHPRTHPIASEFGLRVDGVTVVSFQVKHRRGRARGTARETEFLDITTRLRI
ncbi:MAG TPA: hypothetical protein VJZ91_19290 [Blastocatellia bacterium]|nr:hypothetical protein [Blastocatellia bacterium]